MSDRIAVMNKGRYEQLADPESLYERPKTRFVAGFLGVSNLIAARLDGADDGHAICRLADGTAIRVPRAADRGPGRHRGRRPAREDPDCASWTNRSPMATTSCWARSGTRRISASRRATSSRPAAAAGSPSTSRTSSVPLAPSCGGPGEEVRLTWSPDHTFASRRPARAPRRPTRHPRPPRSRSRYLPRQGAILAATDTDHMAAIDAADDRPKHYTAQRADEGDPDDMTDRIAPQEGAIVSRRRFLQGTALAGFGAFLAACSGGGTPAPSASAAASAAASASAGSSAGASASAGASTGSQEVTGPLELRQLGRLHRPRTTTRSPPRRSRSSRPSTSVDVNYANAKIDDNESFVATIRPQLESGVDTGWDLIVITDWMAAKLVGPGLDREDRPGQHADRAANVRDELKGLPWDPDMNFHFPWQSGATGVGYNVKSTGRDLTKVMDLFDPAFKGKVTLLNELRDIVPADLPRDAGVGQDDLDEQGRGDDRGRRPGRPRLPQAARR